MGSRGTSVRIRDLPPQMREQAKRLKAEGERQAREQFVAYCAGAGLPVPVPEFRFHASRMWRFDWCWPVQLVALEIEGGAFIEGRHTRGAGFVGDLEKYSEAAVYGYRIIRITPEQLYEPRTLSWLKQALAA